MGRSAPERPQQPRLGPFDIVGVNRHSDESYIPFFFVVSPLGEPSFDISFFIPSPDIPSFFIPSLLIPVVLPLSIEPLSIDVESLVMPGFVILSPCAPGPV